MRIKPSDTELSNWYVKQSENVPALLITAQVQDAINMVFKIENELDRLRLLEEYDIKVIAKGHQTFTRSGDYKPITDIHCPTREIEHCGLLDTDVAGGIFTTLYVLLGSHQKSTKSALVRALVLDTNQALLFNRLEAYRSLGHDLADLSGEAIIIVNGQAMAPGTLTFPSSTNWWGEWKTTLEVSPDIPERALLLERTGVVRQALREELSRSFFDWLSKQNKVRQMQHLPQIIRHWGEKRHGPSKWVQKTPSIPCIPVYGRDVDFDMLSYEKATSLRSTVFLPDFREIHDKLIGDNPATRLVITSVKGVGDSVLDVMREIGVPSLRKKAGCPIQILTSEGVKNDPQLDTLFNLAQSKTVIKHLTHTLPEYEVPVSALRRDWRRRLETLQGVRSAGRLSAVYSVLKHKYEVASDSGVDEPTQLLIIDKKADRKLAFYKALADHLFSENSSRLFPLGLLQAIESRHQPDFFDFNVDLEDAYEDSRENETDEESLSMQDPPKKGHGLNPDKLEPVVPQPKPLGDISDETKLSGKKRTPWTGNRSTSSTDNRRNSIEEAEQILELKKNHYAWHCQACLGQYNAIVAAPPGSYVYLPSIRQRLIEAHHVQHLQNKGAIGAKNLVVLCSFHHNLFGDRLSSKAIKDALAIAQQVTRDFPSNAVGTTSIKHDGLLVELKLDSTENSALLFFTRQHADAWMGTNS